MGYDPEGYGRYVVLRSGEYEVLMAHLQEVRVRPGQKVDPGEVVGLEGETGAAKGAHLHLELRQGGKAITDQEAFWEALARLTAPPPPRKEAPPPPSRSGKPHGPRPGATPGGGGAGGQGGGGGGDGRGLPLGAGSPLPYNEGRRRGASARGHPP
ncbi:M23 family metallopeptidase [Thermus antranikianii]|uniref:M23 family metallopeptidase n=1 Tax=Thermus antranikianii TaxID=88190 RepID=UPI001C76EAB7|nr:M23 family metallopeptidase [Thermus antranikianii]QWK20788.1 MAG: M23 family metallopeptidase [Thermus antranikianii]